MTRILTILSVLFLTTVTYAQELKGVVLDENNMPLPGANIVCTQSNANAVTDFDGNFSIKVTAGDKIKVSYIGYKTQELDPVFPSMTITMEPDFNTLEEVVVIGYGSAKKKDLTGSVVKIDGDVVSDKPNSNPVSSIQGRVTGLSVVNTGEIGKDPDIRIRGTVSLQQSKPLFVVDGLFTDNINYLNSNDIESIDVLKDPSSLAIFGVRGANGVIVVTTKKGKSGKLLINFNTSLGLKNVVSYPEMTDANMFKELFAESLENSNLPPYTNFNLYNANTNWAVSITNKNAIVSNNNLSLASGTDRNRIYLGLGNLSEEGLIKNEKYNKFTLNIKDELQLAEKIKLGVGISGYKADLPQLHDFKSALLATPIYAPFNEEYGVYNQAPSEIGGPQIMNPLLSVDVANNGTQINKEYRVVGNIYSEIKFLNNFTFRAEYMADLGYNKGRSYDAGTYKVYANDLTLAAPEDRIVPFGTSLSNVSQYQNEYQKFQQDYLLTYKKDFNNHGLTAMVGFNTFYSDHTKVSGSVKAKNLDEPIPNDPRFWYVNVTPFGDASTKVSDGVEWDMATMSVFSRFLYNFKEKYMLNASFRRDGSSEISPKNRFKNFWTLGAAWDVTKEGFMENQKVFDMFKIKGSYGILGNQYSEHYPFYPTYFSDQNSTAIFADPITGEPMTFPALALKFKFNPDLDWEKLLSREVGFEAEMFDRKLKIDAVYYAKNTENLISFIPGNDPFFINSGEIKNQGIELSVNWNNEVNDNLKYNFGVNFTTLNNEVVSLYKEGYGQFYGSSNQVRYEAGMPVGAFYGYVVEGVYQTFADILYSPQTTNTVVPGDLKFKDISGPDGTPDGKITTDDRTYLGNPTPDFMYGINTGINYKNFDLGIDMQGVYGNEVWRDWGKDNGYAQFNFRAVREDRWYEPGSSNWEPRLASSANNNENSSYFIEDGSYFRIRNVNLGYTFDSSTFGNLKVDNFKLYTNIQNLYTWKWNSGFTPEAGGSTTAFGIDNGGYPIPRIVTLGLNVSF